MLEEKYIDYVKKFEKLDVSSKREIIVNNLEELMELFTKVNVYYGRNTEILPTLSDYETEEEFLTNIFMHIISLKEISAQTLGIILEKGES